MTCDWAKLGPSLPNQAKTNKSDFRFRRSVHATICPCCNLCSSVCRRLMLPTATNTRAKELHMSGNNMSPYCLHVKRWDPSPDQGRRPPRYPILSQRSSCAQRSRLGRTLRRKQLRAEDGCRVEHSVVISAVINLYGTISDKHR